MILTVDLSNSRITMAGVSDGHVLFSCHMATVKSRTSDEYAALMGLLLAREDTDLSALDGCILSSVVPELTLVVRRGLEKLTCRDVMVRAAAEAVMPGAMTPPI